MATISEVANFFCVDRDQVKMWAREFAEHLSFNANPAKGIERQFNQTDLRVLALVAEYWEESPDLECIHIRINSGSFNEERYVEFAYLHTPIFQEAPEEINKDWMHGAMIGGMAGRDLPQVAKAYKSAADELFEQAAGKFYPDEIDYPIFFLYRHAIEIYLKSMLRTPPQTHDLGRLILLLEEQLGGKIAPWVKDRLRDFQRLDQHSDLFRYADLPSDSELWVDFYHLKVVMDQLCDAFEKQLNWKMG